MRAGVRSDLFFEEDAEDGDGCCYYSSGDFDNGPNCDVFAIVEEILLAELDYVHTFDYGAYTRSGGC